MKLRVPIAAAITASLCVSFGRAQTPARPASPAELGDAVASVLQDPALQGAQVGLHVVRLDDGAVLYSHNADDLLVPASNVKLITTAAALHYLGPDYQFPTDVHADWDAHTGVAKRLVVKGYGDPWLIPERLWYLASRIALRGVHELRGDLVVDDTHFEGSRWEQGGEDSHSSYAYLAPAGALTVGFNALLVHVTPALTAGQPARVALDPGSDYARVHGRIQTVRRERTSILVSVRPERDRSVVEVSGRINIDDDGRSYWRRVDNPPVFAGELLKAYLKQVGVRVTGRVVEDVLPADMPKLVSLTSPSLAELVGRVNKHSNNFMAAQLARAVGAHVAGAPGSWEKGKVAIERFLAHLGVEPGSYELHNASGLHDVNRFSARQIIRVLDYMYQQPDLRPEFVASMAVAGGTGTLNERMLNTEAASVLRAKTGTLSMASSLSGFVTTRGGETLGFSFLVNGFKSRIDNVTRAQDQLGALLASLPSGPLDTEGTALTSARIR